MKEARSKRVKIINIGFKAIMTNSVIILDLTHWKTGFQAGNAADLNCPCARRTVIFMWQPASRYWIV